MVETDVVVIVAVVVIVDAYAAHDQSLLVSWPTHRRSIASDYHYCSCSEHQQYTPAYYMLLRLVVGGD